MPLKHNSFEVGSLYSNEEIYKSLGVGNTGGLRAKLNLESQVEHLALFTSFPTKRLTAENPYYDRLEGNVLTYTGAGKSGDQLASGPNSRLFQQIDHKFPIFGFTQIASRRDSTIGVRRWRFEGLLEYLRGYPESQLDAKGEIRKVWIFEFYLHSTIKKIDIHSSGFLMKEIFERSSLERTLDDREILHTSSNEKLSDDIKSQNEFRILEPIRRQLLSYEPRNFEIFIHDLLLHSGFSNIEVTKYSQDGGIDLNAKPNRALWPLSHILLQFQAKRWHHTVGRKEVAEFRGSMQPHAVGCIITTSHFSKAAIRESAESGKVPISVIDGHSLASIISSNEMLSLLK